MSNDIPFWKLRLAVFGTLLWFLFVPLTQKAQEHAFIGTSSFLGGYLLGFLGAFSGYIFWELVDGGGTQFADRDDDLGWLSYVAVATVLTIGALGLYADVFGNTDWRYKCGSLIGAAVVGSGLRPILQKSQRENLARE